MRCIAAVTGLLLVAGCIKGPIGPAGPTGAEGPPGPEKTPIATWVDSTGAVVGPVTGDLYGPVYFDAKGYLWQIDPEAVTLSPLTVGIFFSDSACKDPAFVDASPGQGATVALGQVGTANRPLEPREVFALSVPGYMGNYARNDTAALQDQTTTLYALSSGTQDCIAHGAPALNAPVLLLPVTDITAVTMPTTAFAAPLHREAK